LEHGWERVRYRVRGEFFQLIPDDGPPAGNIAVLSLATTATPNDVVGTTGGVYSGCTGFIAGINDPANAYVSGSSMSQTLDVFGSQITGPMWHDYPRSPEHPGYVYPDDPYQNWYPDQYQDNTPSNYDTHSYINFYANLLTNTTAASNPNAFAFVTVSGAESVTQQYMNWETIPLGTYNGEFGGWRDAEVRRYSSTTNSTANAGKGGPFFGYAGDLTNNYGDLSH